MLRDNTESIEETNKSHVKRVDCPEYKGPGVVIGQEGAVVFVRHGDTCIRVHRLTLRKETTEHVDQPVTRVDYEDDTHLERGHNVLTITQ